MKLIKKIYRYFLPKKRKPFLYDNWDFSNAKNIKDMFQNSKSFKSLDKWIR